ncbi:Autophagy-related protein 12 [Komagataella phaffii CBS 7435]|uniref:Ubiquitin-like protein ATG12 n=2 Tax=Komagataella phaffii TaxID=460519 RepID=C4R4C0_KOMPG|nr:Conserved ubiquitin-like modifier [Komagataella phaffii GS115]AOA63973.1 GQ67_03426T0 [Komagataella phaffii]CAH2449843.1 Autophagy-related protein 12 [Komagataella phaffii CBS 7435]AOA69353.1 GQ68_03395T0 [Komagataella phaffii GS115]CAY70406.1 Conserved ubiquitin-like modifier [Komagataella phaffii GS115]CCA39805.1 Autophagy-related protein 12 [Komagataella phaffii CBS 7435]
MSDDIKEASPPVNNPTLSESAVLDKVPKTSSLLDEIKERHAQEVCKISIRFIPIGSAPEITPKVFKISSSNNFGALLSFLDKRLGNNLIYKNQINHLTGGRIFGYLHNSFAPSPDENLDNLYKNFGINGELVVSYSDRVAFS